MAQYTVCTLEEIQDTVDVTGLFFKKVFGPSEAAHQASSVLKAVASVGNVIAMSYSSVKGITIKQNELN
jgi:hypothetical protein